MVGFYEDTAYITGRFTRDTTISNISKNSSRNPCALQQKVKIATALLKEACDYLLEEPSTYLTRKESLGIGRDPKSNRSRETISLPSVLSGAECPIAYHRFNWIGKTFFVCNHDFFLHIVKANNKCSMMLQKKKLRVTDITFSCRNVLTHK